jgi:hypothetical protein
MKILCIDDNTLYDQCKKGDWYELLNIIDEHILIVNLKGDTRWYLRHRFKTIEEIREDKLNILGI